MLGTVQTSDWWIIILLKEEGNKQTLPHVCVRSPDSWKRKDKEHWELQHQLSLPKQTEWQHNNSRTAKQGRKIKRDGEVDSGLQINKKKWTHTSSHQIKLTAIYKLVKKEKLFSWSPSDVLIVECAPFLIDWPFVISLFIMISVTCVFIQRTQMIKTFQRNSCFLKQKLFGISVDKYQKIWAADTN